MGKCLLELIGDLLIIGYAALTTYLLLLISVNSIVVITESNIILLWGEILAGVAVVCFGVDRLIDDLR